MLKIITRSIRKILNNFGYEIIKQDNAFTPVLKNNWLEKLNISTIIDVGANEGQFIHSISRSIPGRKIVAFEPIKSCFDKLLINTQGMNIEAFNSGLSDHNGTNEINISENFVSSSILPIAELTTDLYPDSKYIKTQKIELKRLDDVVCKMNLSKNILLKIDVQGYEDKVLAGSMESLKNIAVVIIEFSYQPLYKGQWLFDETYQFFISMGFRFAGVNDQAHSTKTGIPIYGDAFFIKNELINNVY